MSAWVFGGADGEFIHSLMRDIPYEGFGRATVNYSAPYSEFTNNRNELPELVVFNINACSHNPVSDTTATSTAEWQTLHDWIDGPYQWCVGLTEWLFSQRAGTRILWITSMECASIGVSSPLDYAQPGCGKIFMYRVQRAMEHQVIHTQNRLISNYQRDNIMMGVCVGSNTPAVAQQINRILHNNTWRRTVIGLTDTENPTSSECVHQQLTEQQLESVSIPNDFVSYHQQKG